MNAKSSLFVISVEAWNYNTKPWLKRSYICYYIICMTVPLKLGFTENSNMNTDNWPLKLVILKTMLLLLENDGGHYE